MNAQISSNASGRESKGRRRQWRWNGCRALAPAGFPPKAEAVEIEVNNGGGIKRENLAENKAADDGDAQGTANFRADALADDHGQGAKQGGHGGHENGTEAQEAGLVNGLARGQVLFALGGQGKVHHENGVLFHNANEEDDADHRDDAQLRITNQQRHHGSNAGGGQRGKNGDGVDVTFVKDTQDN